MSRSLHSLGLAFLSAASLASSPHAQTADLRPTAARAESAALQSGGGSTHLTLYGGIASGDDRWSTGPALAASFTWNVPGTPLSLRIDPYFATHSAAGQSANLRFLGATGNVEFAFLRRGAGAEPYLVGGAGFYSTKTDVAGGGDVDFDASETKPAVAVGGGMRFGRLSFEARLQNVAEFTNVSCLIGFRLGT